MLALGDPGLYKHLAGTLQGSLQFFPQFFLIDVLFFHHKYIRILGQSGHSAV